MHIKIIWLLMEHTYTELGFSVSAMLDGMIAASVAIEYAKTDLDFYLSAFLGGIIVASKAMG